MYINFRKLEAFRPEIKLADSGTTIGSIVRWHRKQKNMTLNEGADGICSISYLSKVENSLIEPSEQILEDLKKRFEFEDLLNYDLLRYQDHYQDIINKLYDYKEIPDFYVKIYSNKKDFKSKLIMFAYYINRDNIYKAKHLYNDLESDLSKFSNEEINLFYFLSSLLLQLEGKYYLALKVLKLCNIVNINSHISKLVDYNKVILKLKLGRHFQSVEITDDLEKRLLQSRNFERYKNIQKNKFLYSLNEFDYNVAITLINDNHILVKKEKQLAKTALSILNHKEVNESYLINNINSSNNFYLLTLLYFDQLEDYEKIKEIMSISTKHKLNPINEQIEFFLESKYTLDNEDFIRYIKNISTNYENSFNGYYALSTLYENASVYYENKTFYKTANLIRKYGKKMLNDLKKSA